MTHVGRHAPHLPVTSLHELQGDPAVGHVFSETHRRIPGWNGRGRIHEPGAARPCLLSLDHHPPAQFVEGGLVGNAFDLDPVFTGVTGLRIQQGVRPDCLIAQQQQSFGFRVQAADGIDPRREPECFEGSPRRTVGGELGEHAARLVECDQHARATGFDSRMGPE